MNYPQKNYDFIKLKYFAKLTKEELTKKTKLNIKKQRAISNNLIALIYFYAKDYDLFQEEVVKTNNEEEVIIPIDQITDFPNHPYKVKNDEKMQSMVQSVKEMGVIYPVIVRKKDNGKYEMISGHRRKMASVLAGKKEIKCIVKFY